MVQMHYRSQRGVGAASTCTTTDNEFKAAHVVSIHVALFLFYIYFI